MKQKTKEILRALSCLFNCWMLSIAGWFFIVFIIKAIEVEPQMKVTWLILCLIGMQLSLRFWMQEARYEYMRRNGQRHPC